MIVGLPQEIINILNYVYFEASNKEDYKNNNCSICMEDFVENQEEPVI